MGISHIRAYYTLSALGIVFTELPERSQKRLSRYPQIGATLLGRIGVDRAYSAELQKKLKEKPRLGEMLLIDVQKKVLKGATTTSGAALFIIDVKQPTSEELADGVRDPMEFYLQYGFVPFPGNLRRLFKLTRVIKKEFAQAGW